MARLLIYDAYENKVYTYANLNENDPMPYSTGRTLTVREFRGKSNSPVLWTTIAAMEAWNLVAKALRNSAYGSEEEFAKLPPAVQRVAHSPSQLREWALMDADTVQSVVASNFQRAYTARQKSDREFEALPPAVRQYVAALTEGESVLKRLEG